MTEPTFSWTPDNVVRLRAMVDEGGTAQAIADVLGCARNAVIGKVHRLGLALARGGGEHEKPAEKQKRDRTLIVKPPAPKVAKPKPAPAPKPSPKPLPVVIAPPVDPTPKRWPKPAGPEAVSIEGLTSQTCRMPLWGDEHRIGLFCGKLVSREGSSWCAACRQLTYEVRPIRAREEADANALKQVRQAARSGAFA